MLQLHSRATTSSSKQNSPQNQFTYSIRIKPKNSSKGTYGSCHRKHSSACTAATNGKAERINRTLTSKSTLFLSFPHLFYTGLGSPCWANQILICFGGLLLQILTEGIKSPRLPIEKQFISTVFLEPNPDGSKRVILNLKELNAFLEPVHFKLEDYRTVAHLLSQGHFMETLDLKEAYYLIALNPTDKKFLRFQFNGQ